MALIALCAALASCRVLDSALKIDPSIAEPVVAAPDDDAREDFDTVRARDPQAAIGEQGHPRILTAHGGVYENEKLESLLAVITGRLIEQTDEPNRAYTITVLNSPSVNAFALPGGYLYVTRGLLALANDSSELAAVLAHEMAHVSSNHGIRRSQQARAADLATQVASDVVSSPLVGKVAQATTRQRLASFSQQQELQADAVGIRHVGKTGYDPFGAVRFLVAMERYSAWRSSFSAPDDDMASSHPSTPRRIELARRHARIAASPGTGETARDRLLEGIDGLTFGETAREGFVRGSSFSHVQLGITFSVLDDFELTNRSDAVIGTGPDEQALRFDAVPAPDAASGPADYIASGWVNGLDPDSVQTGRVRGLPMATAQAEAGDWGFSIAVITAGDTHYRFIMAAPRSVAGSDQRLAAVTETFRQLSASERASLKPLRLRVVTVGQGDTVESLSRRMSDLRRPVALFRALNGLDAGDTIRPGSRVKIVSAQ